MPQTGEGVGQGVPAEHQRAEGHRPGVLGEEPQHGPGKEDASPHHQGGIEQDQPPGLPQALGHPAGLAGGGVLGDEEHQGLGHPEHRHEQKGRELAGAGEAGDGRHTQSAQETLFHQIDHRPRGLLDGVGGR